MSQESNGVIEVLKKDGYDWETYNELKDPQYLGLMENKDWSKGSPRI
jgi:hypothetical protein